MRKRSIFWTLFGVVLVLLMGAGIQSNFLQLGKKAEEDISIIFDTGRGGSNAELKWDEANDKLRFSHDGASYFDIGSGSGSGGGINVVENGDFEAGTNNWTESAGSFTAEIVDVGFGGKSGKWDPTGTGETLDSDAFTVQPLLYNKACAIEFMYKGGDANLKVGAWDGSAYIGDTETLAAQTEWITHYQIFICPASGTIQVRFESTADAAEIKIDQVFMGIKDIKAIPDPRWPSYDHGADFTLTAGSVTGASFTKGVAIPYQTSDGIWRMRFNVRLTHDSDSSFTVAFPNVTFDSSTDQAVSASGNSASISNRCIASGGNNYILITFESTTTTVTQFSGDVVIDAKPTWATKAAPDVYLAGMPDTDALGGDWQSYSLVIDATTTAPTPNSPSINNAWWRRVGDTMEIRYEFYQGSAGTAGIGDYLFPIPSGYTIDTSKVSAGLSKDFNSVGKGQARCSGTGFDTGLKVFDTTNLSMIGSNSTNDAISVGHTSCGLGGSNTGYSFFASVPIQGWTTKEYLANAITGFNTGTPDKAGLVKNNPIYAKAYGTASTNNNIDGFLKYVRFSNVAFDTASGFSLGTQHSISSDDTATKYVIPEDGVYRVTGKVWIDGTLSEGNYLLIRAYANGSSIDDNTTTVGANTTNDHKMFTTGIYSLSAGDYIEIAVEAQSTHTSAQIYVTGVEFTNSFEIEKLGDNN